VQKIIANSTQRSRTVSPEVSKPNLKKFTREQLRLIQQNEMPIGVLQAQAKARKREQERLNREGSSGANLAMPRGIHRPQVNPLSQVSITGDKTVDVNTLNTSIESLER